MRAPRALLAVTGDTGLQAFAAGLIALGYEVVISGPQGRPLAEAGLRVIPVEFATRQANLLGGRLETLHPTLIAGISARREVPRELQALDNRGVAPVDVLVVELPGSEADLAASGRGGDALAGGSELAWAATARAAVANWKGVTVVVDPNDYDDVLAALRDGGPAPERRRALAVKAVAHLGAFDALVARLLAGEAEARPAARGTGRQAWGAAPTGGGGGRAFAGEAAAAGTGFQATARGGVPTPTALPGALPATRYVDAGELLSQACEHRKLAGGRTTVEALVDADIGRSMIEDLPGGYAAALVRHGHACAVAKVEESTSRAMLRAIGSDPKAAVGGTLVASTRVDLTCARALSDHPFAARLETLVAPGFDNEALELLRSRGDLRLVEVDEGAPGGTSGRLRATRFGVLLSELSGPGLTIGDLPPLGQTAVPTALLPALALACCAVRHTASTAAAIADTFGTAAICGGQAHAMDALQIAVAKSRRLTTPVALATDARLDHPDAFQVLGRSRVKLVLHASPEPLNDQMRNAADGAGIAVIGVAEGWHRV